jgi:hypothetical protein
MAAAILPTLLRRNWTVLAGGGEERTDLQAPERAVEGGINLQPCRKRKYMGMSTTIWKALQLCGQQFLLSIKPSFL